MAKYLSKGSNIVAEVVEAKGESYVPSQWWSADSASKKRLKHAIIHRQGEVAKFLVHACTSKDRVYLINASPCTIHSQVRREVVIGYSGFLSPLGMKFIKELERER